MAATSSTGTTGWTRWGAIVVVVGVVGALAAFSTPGSAQTPISPIEVVSLNTDGTAVSPLNTGPRVSDDGKIVVFDSSADALDPADGVVTIRNRDTSTTSSAPDAPSLHPAISGDGCTVAYSVPKPPDQIELVALDRCADPVGSPRAQPTETVATVSIPPGSSVTVLPPPALSVDGTVIVWSTGVGVARYNDTGATWAVQTIVVPTDVVPSATIVAPVVDVSDDGNTIVFAAGPGTAPFEPTTASVFRWSRPESGSDTVTLVSAPVTPPASASGSSTNPSISADGRFVVYQSDDATIAATSKPTTPGPLGTFVVLFDDDPSSAVTPSSKVLAADGARPVISADGSTVAYDTSTDVWRKRSVGATPFATVTDVSLSRARTQGTPATGPSVSGPALSADGTLGVFDSTHGTALTAEPAAASGTHVFARTVVDPSPTTTTTTAATTPSTTRPPTTPPTTSPPTTTPPTTVGPPATTIPATTVPNSTPPASTVPTYRPPATGGSGSNGPQPRPVGSSSTVTYASGTPLAAVAFVPVAVEFSPTIVGAGRQTTTFSLSNPTGGSVQVVDLSIDGDSGGAFTIVDNGCASTSLEPGGTCSVTVVYAPVSIGSATATLTATLSDGSSLGAMLGGTGAPPPTLTVVPGVASSGQVVTVRGAGFPANISVSLTWLGEQLVEPVQTDAAGSFVETLLVLPRTPRGPGTVVVAGQTDQFSTVVGDVLVTGSSDRSTSVLTHSAGRPFGS